MTTTLADALPAEIKRVEEDILPEYEAIPSGEMAAFMMKLDIKAARTAILEGDVVAMMIHYNSLKEYSL